MSLSYGKIFRKGKRLCRWVYNVERGEHKRQLQMKRGKHWKYQGKVYALAAGGAWLVTKAVSLYTWLGRESASNVWR